MSRQTGNTAARQPRLTLAKLAERLDTIQSELNEVLCESADLELGLGLLQKSVDDADPRSTQLDERMFDLQNEVKEIKQTLANLSDIVLHLMENGPHPVPLNAVGMEDGSVDGSLHFQLANHEHWHGKQPEQPQFQHAQGVGLPRQNGTCRGQDLEVFCKAGLPMLQAAPSLSTS